MPKWSLPVDDPEAFLKRIAQWDKNDEVAFKIPVTISSQDSRDVAQSIFDAIYICENLTAALAEPALAIEKHPTNPNQELIVLRGELSQSDIASSFVEEWYDALDPNGSGEEGFLASDDAKRMLAELETPTPHDFKWPELTEWFKSARDEFDDWDPDASW